MPRLGAHKGIGILGAVVLVAVLALAWAAFYREPWAPQPGNYSQQATTTPPVSEQYELTEADNGKSFTYPLTSRFDVILDGTKYPRPYCAPSGIVGEISNIPAVEAPLKAARFEAVAPGSCTLVAGGWQVVIMVTG